MKAYTTSKDEGTVFEPEYPILMRDRYSDMLVLFTSECQGVVLRGSGCHKFGTSRNWDPCTSFGWTPHQGVFHLTITNK